MSRIASLVCVALCSAVLGQGTTPKLTKQEAERMLADYWVEVEIVSGGKTLSHLDHFCWSFSRSHKSPYCWLRHGEATLAECKPIVIERVLDDGTLHVRVNVYPGLMKFVEGGLVVAMPREGGPQGYAGTTQAILDKVTRPKDFTSTPENGHVIRTMKRTKGLYHVDPLPDPPAKDK